MLSERGEEAAAPPPGRFEWVDVARGIGILLVTYGHALRAQMSSNNVDPRWNAPVQDAVIYAFHMPLFFFLAGLFVQRAVARGAKSFFATKVETLIYPYVLWSLVSIGLGTLANGAANRSMNIGMAGHIWYEPVYQYWFLYVLFLCNTAAFAIRGNPIAAAVLVPLGIIGAAGHLPLILSMTLDNFPYFFGGLLASSFVCSERFDERTAFALLGAGIAFALVRILVFPLTPAGLEARLLSVLAAAAGMMIVIGISRLIGNRAPMLAYIGAASMAIYVLHTIFSAGLRIGLYATGFTDPLLALVACTVIGVAGSLVVREFALRYGLMRILALGETGSRKHGKSA